MEAAQSDNIAQLTEVTLNDNEQIVFKTLRDTVKHFDLELTVRAAGGWVRDKILRLESDDIDIVVDKLSGEEFALKVSQFMKDTSQGGCSRVGVVRQNPDQSKHLATACFSLSGISLDVNNLRTETYAADSRIPQVSIGTASEDAHRRDFTINSLFYNLHTGAVEDHVGKGLTDLRAGVIRTPLPPHETFKDDPLRILRAIRFAARLDYRLDEGIIQAAQDPDLAQLLSTKVSRERIGIEVDKMLTAGGEKPTKALLLFEKMELLGPVFLPSDLQFAETDAAPQPKDLRIGVARTRLALPLLCAQASKQDIRLASFAALLSPWRRRCFKEKNKQRPLVHGILRIGLRLPNDLSDLVSAIVRAAYGFFEINRDAEIDDTERRRKTGEQMRAAKEHWRLALALSVVLAEVPDVIDDGSPPTSTDDLMLSKCGEEFDARQKWIQESGLIGCWAWRPFVDGKRLMEAPFSVPKGPRIGTLIEQQIRWRLEDTDFDEAACKRRLLEAAAE